MPVTGNVVSIPAPGGAMWTYLAHPEGRGAHPPVILYFDAPGMREELQAMARRIAGEGYLCLLPDMYYRLGTLRFRLSHRDAAMSAVIRAARQGLGHDQVLPDTKAMLGWLDGHSKARGPAGLIGFCQGGRFVISAAATFADRVRAGAALYGTDTVTAADDSPHLLAGRIRGGLYLGFAEHDPSVPADVIPTLAARLRRNRNVAAEVDVHPGTHHGFCFPDHASYNEAAAERAWQRIFDLFARQLRT